MLTQKSRKLGPRKWNVGKPKSKMEPLLYFPGPENLAKLKVEFE